MKSWIKQLEPIIEEFKEGDPHSPLNSEEVERLSLIIRFKIDVSEGNISEDDIEDALDEHYLNLITLH